MEKENLKLTNTISSLITDDLKKNTKHESLEHAAQILRNVIKLYVSDRIKTDRFSRQHYHNNCNLVNKSK
jgi:hypothetical protein